MAIDLHTENDGRLLHINVSGRLTTDDYKNFIPRFEQLIRPRGRQSILFEMVEFEGWDAGALWMDIRTDLKHYSDFDRIALVGEHTWEKWMAQLYRPFTSAKTRYFDRSEMHAARQWAAHKTVAAREYPKASPSSEKTSS